MSNLYVSQRLISHPISVLKKKKKSSHCDVKATTGKQRQRRLSTKQAEFVLLHWTRHSSAAHGVMKSGISNTTSSSSGNSPDCLWDPHRWAA